MTDHEMRAIDLVMSLRCARLFAVVCKKDDIPLTAMTSMGHEEAFLTGPRTKSGWNDLIHMDNELTWGMMFGFVPSVLRTR